MKNSNDTIENRTRDPPTFSAVPQPTALHRAPKHIVLYRVIQEERSIFWEGIVSVIVKKKIHINMCLILNCGRNGAV